MSIERNRAVRWLLRFVILATVSYTGVDAHAQGRERLRGGDQRVVSEIVVDAPEGLYRSARAAVSVREGAPYTILDLSRTIQNIYALGGVSDVQVHREETADGVRLAFTVLPAANLYGMEFEGDSPVRRNVLRDVLTARPGDRITRALLEEQADRVQQALSDRGYRQAVVEPELLLREDQLSASIVFHLFPGQATRLERLDFVGDLGISERETRLAFGIAEGDVYRTDLLADGIDELRRRLAEGRFFHAEIAIDAEATNLERNTADLQIRVAAGPAVELNFRGWNRSENELREMLPFFEEATVADWILNQARADVIAALQEQGHWKPLVTYGRTRDDQGRNVVVNFTVFPASTAKVRQIDFDGNASIPSLQLAATTRTRVHRTLRGSPFSSATWDADQRAVLALYRRSGFLEARIVDAPVVNDADLDGLVARMLIEEGERTTVGQLDIAAGGDLDTYGINTSGWASQLRLRGGGPFDPDAVRQDETTLRVLLANQGFRRAIVRSLVEETDDPLVVNVGFEVLPGERVRVGQLLVSGNTRVREEVIRRQLSLVPGSPFTQQDVILSQSRLYQLGLFSRVEIATARPDSTDVEPTVVVRVDEGSSQRLSWGLGYSTEEQVRGLVVIGQDNLWGRNHRVTTSVRASFAEQRARLVYTDPYLLGRSIEGSAVGYFDSIDREGFKVQRLGASVQLVKRHSEALTSIGRYSFRDQQAFDIEIDDDLLEPEDTDAVVGSVIYSLLADTRPDPIDPSQGSYNAIDVELAERALGSESNFLRLFGRSYWYWEGPGNSVLVAAARAGLALPYGDSVVPLPERFFAGGSTTLRGLGRNLAGPLSSNGNPFGGDVLLIGNLEYRFPVRGNLGAVIFTDVGNVFANTESVTFPGIRETIGMGVRYATPIGPLRLDWGYLVDARPGEDSSRLHFAIGQAF